MLNCCLHLYRCRHQGRRYMSRYPPLPLPNPCQSTTYQLLADCSMSCCALVLLFCYVVFSCMQA
jgi:hypothetical protein